MVFVWLSFLPFDKALLWKVDYPCFPSVTSDSKEEKIKLQRTHARVASI